MWAGPTFEYSMTMLPWSVEWFDSVAAASRSMVKVPLPRWRMPLGSALPWRTVTKGDPAGAALDCASRCQSNDSPSAFFETMSWYVFGSSAFDPGPQVQELSVQEVAGVLVTAST